MDIVSVIFATYNEKEEYLEASITSVMNQSYNNIEIIVCLEPEDKNRSLIERILKDFKKKKIFVSKTKLGLSKSLNKAIVLATGRYIARMDSDDIWDTNKIEDQLKYLKNYNLDIVGCDIRLIDEYNLHFGNRIYSKKSVDTNFLLTTGLCHPSVLLKNSLFQKFGNYNENFKRSEDLELWLRLISKNVKIGYTPRILMSYRIRKKFNRDLMHWKYNLIARRKYLFKIYSFHRAILSLFVIFAIYLSTLFYMNQLFQLFYKKFVINEKE